MKQMETFDIRDWEEVFSPELQEKVVEALERGKVVYFPSLAFPLSPQEMRYLNPQIVDPKSKNISYDIRKDAIGGSLCCGKEADQLKEMVKRYALASRCFVNRLIPHYTYHLIQAKTSFRPVEVLGRKSSYRKDDTRLHVDSFPSSPTKGKRILRMFTNVNPEGKPRVWRLGEPFEDVVKKIAPKVSPPLSGFASILQFMKITKDYRTAYDHYMLQIHNTMKKDMKYQRSVSQEEVKFPPGSSWMVYTDQASHAAMSGQHLFEQTYHLPVTGLKNEQTSPLRILEKFLNKTLV